jgi:hypothetical protein
LLLFTEPRRRSVLRSSWAQAIYKFSMTRPPDWPPSTASCASAMRTSGKRGATRGGAGEPTISGVLAFPEVGFLRCADPVLWVHPRFEGMFPQALNDLETRFAPYAPDVVPTLIIRPAKKTNLLGNLGFVEKR